jgi:hypothetical protein
MLMSFEKSAFICKSDHETMTLLQELGIANKLRWRTTRERCLRAVLHAKRFLREGECRMTTVTAIRGLRMSLLPDFLLQRSILTNSGVLL